MFVPKLNSKSVYIGQNKKPKRSNKYLEYPFKKSFDIDTMILLINTFIIKSFEE